MSQELVQFNKCKVSKVGLTFNEEMTFEEWQGIGLQLQLMHGSVGFWIGDWLNFGEKHYGETYTQAVEDTGLDYSTLSGYKWVSGAVETSRRRENLSFSCHREVAKLPPEKQIELLEKGEKEGWGAREFAHVGKELLKLPTPPLPEGKFDVVYADPAWEYSNSGFSMSAEKQYPTMSTDKIENLTDNNGNKVQNIIAENAVLLMWVTNPLLEDGMRVLKSWGFDYKTNMVWTKTNATGGFYVLGKHELLLIGVKGKKMLPDKMFESIILGKNLVHSKKPEMYNQIEQMYPNRKYVELFARNNREGWKSWGNEI